MKWATAEPAFSIKVMDGTPKRSEVARSISRISAALTIFIGCLARRPCCSSRNPSIARVARKCPKGINHEGHEVTRRRESPEGFLHGPSCPWWLMISLPAVAFGCAARSWLLRCHTVMPTLIPHPTRIESAGNEPKIIEECLLDSCKRTAVNLVGGHHALPLTIDRCSTRLWSADD